jgi:hypothetical protein
MSDARHMGHYYAPDSADMDSRSVVCPQCGGVNWVFVICKDTYLGNIYLDRCGENCAVSDTVDAVPEYPSSTKVYVCRDCKYTVAMSSEGAETEDLDPHEHSDFRGRLLEARMVKSTDSIDVQILYDEIDRLKEIAVRGIAGHHNFRKLLEYSGLMPDKFGVIPADKLEEIWSEALEYARKHVEEKLECARCGNGEYCDYLRWCEEVGQGV